MFHKSLDRRRVIFAVNIVMIVMSLVASVFFSRRFHHFVNFFRRLRCQLKVLESSIKIFILHLETNNLVVKGHVMNVEKKILSADVRCKQECFLQSSVAQ